ncbi:MAG: hypothetical protein AAFN10_26780, partial [Bacteroidota bacterium]
MKKILTPLFCLFLAIGSIQNLNAQLGPDTATVETGHFVKFDVRGNDSASSLAWPLCDGWWQPPSFTSNAGGSWVIMPDDSIRYLPPHGFVGEDWFLYAICNPNTGYQIDTGRVTIFVTATDSVWPGDANSDGVANNLDLLQLGLGFYYVGSARDSVSNTWEAK